jgi:hypothetical protein
MYESGPLNVTAIRPPSGGGGLTVVSLDALGTEQRLTSPTGGTDVFNYTNLTSNSVSNQAITACFVADADDALGAVGPTAVTAVYDPAGVNQSMTQIITSVNGGGNIFVAWFGLVAPLSFGNKTIQFTMVTSTRNAYFCAASWKGVNQAGGTTSFANGASAVIASGNPLSLAITSQLNDQVLAALSSRFTNMTGNLYGTPIFFDDTNGLIANGGADYVTGAASVTCGNTQNAGAGTNPIAAFDLVHA